MTINHVIQGIVGTVTYGIWGGVAYYIPDNRQSFISFTIAICTGVIGLALRDMQVPADTTTVVPKIPEPVSYNKDASVVQFKNAPTNITVEK